MEKPNFVLAVLLMDGRYVMQLRDNKPGIVAPGMWALFGGRVEAGEEPQAALLREIEEELCIILPKCRLLGSFERYGDFFASDGQYHLFEADITQWWGQHCLTEGQAAEHFAFEELRALTMPPVVREILEKHDAKTVWR